jgi:hypothetical protein
MAVIYSDKYKGFAFSGAIPFYLTKGVEGGA